MKKTINKQRALKRALNQIVNKGKGSGEGLQEGTLPWGDLLFGCPVEAGEFITTGGYITTSMSDESDESEEKNNEK